MDTAQRTRREAVLQGLDVAHLRGAEIGPLNRPLIRKDESEVYYVDHCSTAELKTKYASDPNVECGNIVDIDFIWADDPAKDLLRDVRPLDYVVASHVVEHVPDLIGWLHEMRDILRDGGSLILAVPDRRFTFDYFRRTSAMEEIRTAHAEARRRPGLRCIMDHIANVVQADAWGLWDDPGKADEFPLRDASLLSLAATHYAEGRYIDVHCWVFTPPSFLSTIGKIVRETDLGFNLESFRTTAYHEIEFYVRLVKVARSTTDWEKAAAEARSHPIRPKTSSDELASGSTLVETLTANLAEATQRAESAEAKSAQLTSRITALENSTSWRVTGPIRAVVGAWRR